MNLVLVGVRGSGKTAVGAALASRLNLAFVDLDAQIEKLAGKTVAAVLTEDGEQVFRQLETRVLRELPIRDGTLIATGGGVVLSSKNRERLRKLGKVIWLQVSPEEAVRRVTGSKNRPPLTCLAPLDEAQEVAVQRFEYYLRLADCIVETDGRSLQEVCDELEQLWHTLSSNHVR